MAVASSLSGPSPSQPRLYRFVTLLSLLLSDGTYTCLRRYSRGVLHETYSVNEVLLMAEVLKLGFSFCVMMANRNRTGSAEGFMNDNYMNYLMQLLLRSKKMLILSLIYGAGNVLSYFALARIGEFFVFGVLLSPDNISGNLKLDFHSLRC
jgi:hypothetical protein